MLYLCKLCGSINSIMDYLDAHTTVGISGCGLCTNGICKIYSNESDKTEHLTQ